MIQATPIPVIEESASAEPDATYEALRLRSSCDLLSGAARALIEALRPSPHRGRVTSAPIQ